MFPRAWASFWSKNFVSNQEKKRFILYRLSCDHSKRVNVFIVASRNVWAANMKRNFCVLTNHARVWSFLHINLLQNLSCIQKRSQCEWFLDNAHFVLSRCLTLMTTLSYIGCTKTRSLPLIEAALMLCTIRLQFTRWLWRKRKHLPW